MSTAATNKAPARRYANTRLERASVEEIRALQLQRVRAVLASAHARNPFYRERLDRAGVRPGDIRSLDDFRERVPFIDKRALLDDQARHPPYGRRGDVEGAHIHTVTHTGGTSGIGQELHMLTELDTELWTTGFFYECAWAGIQPGDRVVRFIRVAMELGGLWHKSAGDRFGLSQFFIGAYDSPTRLKLMQRISPNLIIAQPSYLTRLSLMCEEAGIVPREVFPDLKAVMFAGEAHGGVTWLRRMEDFWGVKLAEWYGSTQAAGSHMFSCEGGLHFDDGRLRMLHNLDHRIYCEVLDLETGQPVKSGEYGELVITNLYNENFPIIRFRTHDRVRFRDAGYCDCGRPFSGIESGSVSRVDDMLKVRGQNLWPDSVGAVIFNHPEIEEYQGLVWVDETGRERVRVSVEFRPGSPPGEARDALRARLRDEIKQRTDITMDLAEAPAGTLPRFEQKARRWQDERGASRQSAVERLGQGQAEQSGRTESRP